MWYVFRDDLNELLADKKQPSCSKCQKKNIECIYVEHKKKRPVPQQVTEAESPSTYRDLGISIESIPNHMLLSHSIRHNTIDAYFEVISLGCPFIEKEELQRFIFSNDLSQNLELLGLVLSIQALCEQRFGFSDLAQDSANKTRQILQQYFDNCDSFYVACTYVNLGLFFSGEGNVKKARFYSYCADYYCKNMDRTCWNEYQRNLNWTKITLEYNINFPFLKPSDLFHIFKDIQQIDMPQEWKDAILDIENSTIQNVEERIVIYSMIAHCAKGKRRMTGFGTIICDLIHESMQYGIGIAMLSFVDPIFFKNRIYELALQMTKLTEHEHFMYCPPVIIQNFLMAIKVHLEFHKFIETEGLDKNEYYNVASRNLRAINMLKNRYNIINKNYMDVVHELERVALYSGWTEEPESHATVEPIDKISRLVSFNEELRGFMQRFFNLLPWEQVRVTTSLDTNDNSDPFLTDDIFECFDFDQLSDSVNF